MSEPVIEARNLSKTFRGGTVAVSGLDLAVAPGTVYGLIGRNGAGKTTALRMLMGLLRPDGGTARVLGADLWTAPRETRARVAYVPQDQQLHAWMTLTEHCTYLAHFYDRWDPAYARRLAGRFELTPDRQVGLLSGGERRKVSVALALAARPEILLLDEPAAGLDPVARRELIDVLVDILASGEGCTVLFSTHILSDLERIAEQVGIMDRGRIVTAASLDDLQSHTRRVQVIFPGDRAPDGFAVPGALRTTVEGPVVTAVARLDSETQLDAVRAMEGVRVQVFLLGLEDIFIALFGREPAGELLEEPQ